MTKWQYWAGWLVAGVAFLVAEYWIIRWAIRAEMGWRIFRG